MSTTREPLGAGSISLGLHRHAVADASQAAALMLAEGRAAEAAGFDGVTMSEHHLGFPGYFPNPLASAAAVLDHTDAIWAGPMPMLLTLRHPALVAEDVAWLGATHPDRVVAGFAAGNQPAEHEMVGNDEADTTKIYAANLKAVGEALGPPAGEHLLDADPAVAAQRGRVPMVSAAKSRTAVRRAARSGIGLLYSSRSTAEEMGALSDHYVEQGGTGRRIAVAEIWLGDPPTLSDEGSSVWTSLDWDPDWRMHGDAASLVQQLTAFVKTARADALNVRVHVSRVPIAAIAEQIVGVGADVVPQLRAKFADVLATRAA